MVKEHIRLEDAMTMKLEQPFRTWSVPGLHVEDEDIPQDVDIEITCVSKSPNRAFVVGIHFTKADKSRYIGTIAEFSDLEELRKAYPQLFELDGELLAYS